MTKSIIIYGPTVSGKTKLALKIAGKFNGELVSADSRQVFSGLDIGSGKIPFGSKFERYQDYWIVDGIKIHGFDIKKPGNQFSASDFLKFTASTVKKIRNNQKLPIIVGGTAFYINALVNGIETVGIAPNIKLRKSLEKLKAQDLYLKLENLNPHKAYSLNESDKKNPRRLIRAIEISLSKPVVELDRTPGEQEYFMIGLNAPNDFLYNKADAWLEERMKKGLIEEVNSLIKITGVKWLESLGLEYRWVSRYLTNQISEKEMKERLKGDIHSYIRRQKTWFSKFPGIMVFDVSVANWENKVISALNLVQSK